MHTNLASRRSSVHRVISVVVAAASIAAAGSAHADNNRSSGDNKGGAVLLELGASATGFVLQPKNGPTYLGRGPGLGVHLALSLDAKATHRLFIGARWTGLESMESLLEDGEAPKNDAPTALDAIEEVPAMIGLGYSVGIADTGLRAGFVTGYANVQHNDSYTGGWVFGVFVQVPVLTFRLGG